MKQINYSTCVSKHLNDARVSITAIEQTLNQNGCFEPVLAAICLNGQLESVPERVVYSLAQPSRYRRAVEAIRIRDQVDAAVDNAIKAWARHYRRVIKSGATLGAVEPVPRRLPRDIATADFLRRLAVAKVRLMTRSAAAFSAPDTARSSEV